MAIINTFPKCLESPYLFHDATAPDRVGDLLTLAGDRLGAASDLLGLPKSDAGDVGGLAYESMFATLRALVYAKEYREAGLRCLLLACEALYVRPGRLEAGHIHNFERVQGLKLAPAEAVGAAREFLERARGLVGHVGAGRPGRGGELDRVGDL